MKRENITADEVRRLLHYDPLTGIFTRKVTTCARGKAGAVAGTLNDSGYILIALHSLQYRAHRLAWLYMTGEWPKHEVDHINCVRDDNRWENLRDLPTRINSQNRRHAMKNSKTGLLGASWNAKDQKFAARLKVGSRYLSLGYHDTAEAAHAAYVAAKRTHHPGCTL